MVDQALPESVLDWSNPDLLGDPYWGSSSLLGGFVGLSWVSLTAPERRRFTNVAISYWAAVPWRDMPHTDSDGRLIGRYPAGMKVLRDSLVEAGTQQLYLASANSFEQGCIAAFVALVRWVWESDAKPLTPERAEGGRRESLILGASGFASSVNTDARSVINHLPLQTQNWILSSGLLRDDARSGRGARPVALDSVGGAVGSAATSDSVALLQAEISEIDGRLDALEVSEITGVERAMLDGLTFPYGFDGTLTLDENVDEPGEVLLSTNDVPPDGQTATNFLLVETEPYKTQALLRGCGVGNHVRVRMADGSAELIVKVAYAEDSSTDANDRYLWYTTPLYSRGLDQYGQLPAGAMRFDFSSDASGLFAEKIYGGVLQPSAWVNLFSKSEADLAFGESWLHSSKLVLVSASASLSDDVHTDSGPVAMIRGSELDDGVQLSLGPGGVDSFSFLATGSATGQMTADTWYDSGIDLDSGWVGPLYLSAGAGKEDVTTFFPGDLVTGTIGDSAGGFRGFRGVAKDSSDNLLIAYAVGHGSVTPKLYGTRRPGYVEIQRQGSPPQRNGIRARVVNGWPPLSSTGVDLSLYLVNTL